MRFNAKILLFGEYTVLQNSDALLIPYPNFSGELGFFDDHTDPNNLELKESNKSLKNFYKHIETVLPKTIFGKKFDLEQLSKDIQNGLYFQSTIPVGYGVGSSGALVAAMVSKYFLRNEEIRTDQQLHELKKSLALLESFFHGNSSGMDPLVSYLNKPILVQKGQVLIKNISFGNFKAFLIDSGKSRSTGRLLEVYIQKCKKPDYVEVINSEIVRINNQCISLFIMQDENNIFSALKELSGYQFEYMHEMILPEFGEIWKYGLDSDEFYLKLCGAGGGGYFLGFTRDFQKVLEWGHNVNMKILEI